MSPRKKSESNEDIQDLDTVESKSITKDESEAGLVANVAAPVSEPLPHVSAVVAAPAAAPVKFAPVVVAATTPGTRLINTPYLVPGTVVRQLQAGNAPNVVRHLVRLDYYNYPVVM